jgi:signal transduction histidine kinase
MNGFKQVQFEISEGKQLYLYSDYKIISFIITNLVENAIRFSRKEQDSYIRIQFKVMNKVLLVSVIDNGVGISAEEVPGIFNLFSPAAGKYKTAGMGLYMAKISAEKLHGKLLLAKNQTNYTHFEVQIPLLK